MIINSLFNRESIGLLRNYNVLNQSMGSVLVIIDYFKRKLVFLFYPLSSSHSAPPPPSPSPLSFFLPCPFSTTFLISEPSYKNITALKCIKVWIRDRFCCCFGIYSYYGGLCNFLWCGWNGGLRKGFYVLRVSLRERWRWNIWFPN